METLVVSFKNHEWYAIFFFLLVLNYLESTSTINQQMHLYNFRLKHLKPLRHVSIFTDHHQGVSSFLAKVITYSQYISFL